MIAVSDNLQKHVEEAKLLNCKVRADKTCNVRSAHEAYSGLEAVTGDREQFYKGFKAKSCWHFFFFLPEEHHELIRKLITYCLKSEKLQKLPSGL